MVSVQLSYSSYVPMACLCDRALTKCISCSISTGKTELHHHVNYSYASVWLAFEESLYNLADFGLYLKFVNVLKELQESKRSIGYHLFPSALCKCFAQLFNNMKCYSLYIYKFLLI